MKKKTGWTRHYRDDIGIWEDICPHGIGHSSGIHGCDSCCLNLDKKDKEVEKLAVDAVREERKKKELPHCSGCSEDSWDSPEGRTHSFGTVEHPHPAYYSEAKTKQLCQHCHKREASVQWVGDGGIIAMTHGMYENWCDFCATTEQLKHARRSAKHIPRLEKKLKKLK